jgi:hypothetical protein
MSSQVIPPVNVGSKRTGCLAGMSSASCGRCRASDRREDRGEGGAVDAPFASLRAISQLKRARNRALALDGIQ